MGCWGLSSQVLSSFVAGCPPFLGWLAPFPLLGVPHLPVLGVSSSPILCLVAPPSCAACRSPLSVLDGGEGSLCHQFPTAAETDKILCGPRLRSRSFGFHCVWTCEKSWEHVASLPPSLGLAGIGRKCPKRRGPWWQAMGAGRSQRCRPGDSGQHRGTLQNTV